jgi:hypothetical protein
MRRLYAGFVVLVAASMLAQTAGTTDKPAVEVHVRSVQMGEVCGWCTGGWYHTTITTVRPSNVVEELKDANYPRQYPNRKEERAITKKEWKALVRSIDAKALRAVPQDGTCRPCVDQPDAWVVIEYSDGSKISINYPPTIVPAAVRALKIPGIAIALYPHGQHARQ